MGPPYDGVRADLGAPWALPSEACASVIAPRPCSSSPPALGALQAIVVQRDLSSFRHTRAPRSKSQQVRQRAAVAGMGASSTLQ